MFKFLGEPYAKSESRRESSLSFCLCSNHVGDKFISNLRDRLYGDLICIHFSKLNHFLDSSALKSWNDNLISEIIGRDFYVSVEINNSNESAGF